MGDYLSLWPEPAVAGAAAMLLQDIPSLTPPQVKAALVGNATSGTRGAPLIQNLSSGSPDKLLYIPPPSVPITVGGSTGSQSVGTGAAGFDFTFGCRTFSAGDSNGS